MALEVIVEVLVIVSVSGLDIVHLFLVLCEVNQTLSLFRGAFGKRNHAIKNSGSCSRDYCKYVDCGNRSLFGMR